MTAAIGAPETQADAVVRRIIQEADRLHADPEVRTAEEKYLDRLADYENARRQLEAASFELGQVTRRVLSR